MKNIINRVDYLNKEFWMFGSDKNNADEIGRLWERLVSLEKHTATQDSVIKNFEERTQKASESKEEIFSVLQSSRVHKGQIKKVKNEINELASVVNDIYTKANELMSQINANHDGIKQKLGEIEESKLEAEKSCEEAATSLTIVHDSISDVKTIIEENEDFGSLIETSLNQLDQIEESYTKSNTLLKSITSNHSKVRELRNEIFGFESTGEDNEVEVVEGLKHELEKSYYNLKQDLEGYKTEFGELNETTDEKYNEILSDSKSSFSDFIDECSAQYKDTYSDIRKLLPEALTAGLSAAYDKKVEIEKTEIINYQSSFAKSILGLIGVSLIPFAIDIYLLLVAQKDLVEVLSDTPKLIISIMPIYFPILWFAYSSNKKINLSKRLIEEYTHKGVLSKTYEGLSNQINEMTDDDNSNELRVKLLFNLLHVNSENPGKLISDYDTTDHPLIDALDKSVKLADSVDKLKNIPGFSTLTSKLAKQRKDIIDDVDKKSSEVLNEVVEKEKA
ncbi:hypothetical protein [Paraglaciecola sp.]|uniref:hypothetical protein n=1 Tax=Paraglaciecola sp. TaxID=1920173 RepID=UPI003EF292BC